LAWTLAVLCSYFRINLCTFFHKRASFFPVISTGNADVQAKTRELFEAELAKLN